MFLFDKNDYHKVIAEIRATIDEEGDIVHKIPLELWERYKDVIMPKALRYGLEKSDHFAMPIEIMRMATRLTFEPLPIQIPKSTERSVKRVIEFVIDGNLENSLAQLFIYDWLGFRQPRIDYTKKS